MLSPEGLGEIGAARADEESGQHALLTALRVTQRERRRVGPEEVLYIAELLSLSPATVQGVARFYDQITNEPTGPHVLSLCRGISCYLCGADEVLREIAQALGTVPGGTSADGRITLRLAECIGDCDHAPAALLDQDFIGPVGPSVLPVLKGS